MNEAPTHIKKLNDIKGFTETFIEMLTHYQAHEDAYEAVERIYQRYYGVRKYSNYNSFRVCRDRFYKSQIPIE